MLGHAPPERPFRSTGKGGGSLIGKPQKDWPMIVLVVIDAIYIRYKGTIDRAIACKKSMPEKEWIQALDTLMPGWQEMALKTQGPRKSRYSLLLKNRSYKMYWEKRKSVFSKEHWFHKVPSGHPYYEIHDKILRGQISVLTNWKELWERDAGLSRSERTRVFEREAEANPR